MTPTFRAVLCAGALCGCVRPATPPEPSAKPTTLEVRTDLTQRPKEDRQSACDACLAYILRDTQVVEPYINLNQPKYYFCSDTKLLDSAYSPPPFEFQPLHRILPEQAPGIDETESKAVIFLLSSIDVFELKGTRRCHAFIVVSPAGRDADTTGMWLRFQLRYEQGGWVVDSWEQQS